MNKVVTIFSTLILSLAAQPVLAQTAAPQFCMYRHYGQYADSVIVGQTDCSSGLFYNNGKWLFTGGQYAESLDQNEEVLNRAGFLKDQTFPVRNEGKPDQSMILFRMPNDGLNEICVVNSNTEAKTLVGCTKGTELEIEGNDKTLSPEIILGRNGFKLVSAIKENHAKSSIFRNTLNIYAK